MPSEEFLNEYYTSEYYSEFSGGSHLFAVKKMFLKFRAASQYRYITQAFRTGKVGTVLETGSGDGTFLSYFKRAGYTVTGLEYNEFTRRKARDQYGITLQNRDILDVGPDEGKYDVIALSHVLEHMTKPVDVLKHCRHLLNDNGVVFIELPCSPVPEETHEKELIEFLETTHLYNFRFASMKALCELSGLNILRIDRYDYPVLRLFSAYRKKISRTLMTGHPESANPIRNIPEVITVSQMLIRHMFKTGAMIYVPENLPWQGLGDNLRVIAQAH